MKSEWRNIGFNVHQKTIGIFEMYVSWGKRDTRIGYLVRFESADLAAVFESLNQAKEYADKLAKRKLSDALEQL